MSREKMDPAATISVLDQKYLVINLRAPGIRSLAGMWCGGRRHDWRSLLSYFLDFIEEMISLPVVRVGETEDPLEALATRIRCDLKDETGADP